MKWEKKRKSNEETQQQHTHFDARAQKLNKFEATESVCFFPVSLHSTIRFAFQHLYYFFLLLSSLLRADSFVIYIHNWTLWLNNDKHKKNENCTLNAHHLIFAAQETDNDKKKQLMEVRQSMNYDAEGKRNWHRVKALSNEKIEKWGN